MKIVRRVLLIVLLVLLPLASGFVLLVGPWSVYTASNYEQSAYFARALAAIDAAAAKTSVAEAAAPLQAGWAEREITPEPGHPMAGYGGRPNQKRSTGVKEPLFVRALALNDGTDTVVLIGSDMLQTLPNLLEQVEARTLAQIGLTNRHIMYTSSHTHCGPGGLAPGFAAELSYGPYAPAYVEFLAGQFADAIVEAVQRLAPARFGHGAIEAPHYIRNRTRDHGTVDSTLHVAVVERVEEGERLYLARYSAHSTAYSQDMLELNNDYGGAFQRAVFEQTGAPLLFMGGAMGAMGPNPPGPSVPAPQNEAQRMGFEHDAESDLVRQGKKTLEDMLSDQRARVEAMGAGLAARLLQAVQTLEMEDHLVAASLDAWYDPPPAQVRILSPRWRLSPWAFHLLGVPKTGRLQAARIGSLFLIGMPYDFSGETSREWQAWAAEQGASLWVTGFSGAYLGYLSPDKYYHEMGEGFSYNQNYEIGQMNWFGPNQEAYVTDLFQHAFHALH